MLNKNKLRLKHGAKENRPRLLNFEELEMAVKIMSKAFYKDPLWVYLLTDEVRRKKF